MAPVGLTRAEQQARTRARLVAAAAVLFAERGFDGSSLEEIAARAGLTRGAIYSNFDTKEDILLAVAQSQAISADETALASGGRDVAERLAAFARSVLVREAQARDQAAFEFELARVAMVNPTVRAALVHSQRKLLNALAEQIQTAAEECGVELTVAPRQVAATLVALCRGLLGLRLIDQRAVPEQLVSDSARRLADSVTTKGGAGRRRGRIS